ncbi:hypothetical protein NC653_025272 [Populus alba x Populus x berolinensis]|uniref:Uncharacterized protein n=1 Tax=Populus alba x Populus x berolinensis TaxID=444605 RepID=A0AAD6MAU6_9ROSI|nr:hypothetical protein NC653_025272 [Populus alba x Populus x berolinensis]
MAIVRGFFSQKLHIKCSSSSQENGQWKITMYPFTVSMDMVQVSNVKIILCFHEEILKMGTSSEILIFRSAVMWLSIFKTIRLLYLMSHSRFFCAYDKYWRIQKKLNLKLSRSASKGLLFCVAECTRIFEGQGDGMSSCLPEYERDPSSLGVNQQRWSADKLFRLIGCVCLCVAPMRFQRSKFLASSSFFLFFLTVLPGSKLDSASFLSVYRHRGCERWDGSTTKREYTFCEQGNPNLSSFLNVSINNSCLPHSLWLILF